MTRDETIADIKNYLGIKSKTTGLGFIVCVIENLPGGLGVDVVKNCDDSLYSFILEKELERLRTKGVSTDELSRLEQMHSDRCRTISRSSKDSRDVN